MKKWILTFLILVLLGDCYTQCITQCNTNVGYYSNNDPKTIGYDNMGSSYHSTYAAEPNGYIVWGEHMHSNGSSHILNPQTINSTNYPTLTGDVLLVGLGSHNWLNVQLIVLTSTGLFASGTAGAVLSTSIKSNSPFSKITVNGKSDGLPAGIGPDSVKMMFVTFRSIIITTCGGRVYVLSQDANMRGSAGSGSATVWAQVKQSTTTYLTDVIAVRGNRGFAFALRSDSTLWTWGDGVLLGNGTGAANYNYARQMTKPSGLTGIKMIQATESYNSSTPNKSYYILGTDGKVYAMGNNGFGQLGDNTNTNRTVWVNCKAQGSSAVINDARWISANEHDAYYPNLGVLRGLGKMLACGSNTTYMTARTTNHGVNYLNYPSGVSASDTILFCEMGGHTSAFVKINTPRYGYTGHHRNGSIGNGSTSNSVLTSVSFTVPPVINVCGTRCDTPTLSKLPYSCTDTQAIFLVKGRAGNKLTYIVNSGTVDSVIIGSGDSVRIVFDNPTTSLEFKILKVSTISCELTLNITDTINRFTVRDSSLAICKGESIAFKGTQIFASGIYKDTLVNSQFCDSFFNLTLIVKDTSARDSFRTICKGEAVSFKGESINTSGLYRDTLVNSQGCDSFFYLYLTVNDTVRKDSFKTICKGESVYFNNQTLLSAGVYKDTFSNFQGCDSFVYLHLTVSDTSRKDSTISTCVNFPIQFNGQMIISSGLYRDTLVNSNGCDSFLSFNIIVKDTSKRDSFLTICKNDFVSFNDQTLNSSGLYKDTLVNSQGCDSFIYLYLTVNDTTEKDSFLTICKNDFVSFNGQTLNSSGLYKDTLVNYMGCDSFVYLHLTVHDTVKKDSNIVSCVHHPIQFNGLTITTSGIYKDTLVSSLGCDSFLYFNITVHDTSKRDTFLTLCSNETISFNGQAINTTGLYKDTLVNSQGCDSFVYLYLTVNDTSKRDSFLTICKNESILFNGQTLNSSGVYKDTLINYQGCDSFVYLHLTVNDTVRKDTFLTICKNQSVSFNGQILNSTGVYRDTLVSYLSCDSFIYFHLTVHDTSRKDSTFITCINNPIQFNGQTILSSGLYKDTLVNFLGCDSFLYFNITVNDTTRKDSFLSICKNQSVSFNGQTLNSSGVYTDTLTNSQGCDSFFYLHLTVKDTAKRDSFLTICRNHPISFNGQILNSSGVYKDTFQNSQGCDSFLYLHLNVKDTSRRDMAMSICKNKPIQFNGLTISNTGLYKDTLVNSQGCDSFIFFTVVVVDTTKEDLFITTCKNQSISFNGNSINNSGLYKDTLTNVRGCDSFVYLYLTVNDTLRRDSFLTICINQSVSFNGQSLNTSGVYKDTFTSVSSCDSFVYLHLTVEDTLRTDTFRAICYNEAINFNNQSLNTTGLYKDTFITSQGCDSFVYLHLTVHDSTRRDSSVTICINEPFSFNGQIINSPGVYKDTFVNFNGCDSFFYLTVSVIDTSRKDSFKTICVNEPIVFKGQSLNTSGIYKDTLVNALDCDSFFYLHLTVLDTTNRDSFLTICKNYPINFNGQTINTTGIYKDTFVNALGCDSFFYLHLTVADTSSKDSFLIFCKNQSITIKGQTINTTGIYKDTFVNALGCDSFFYFHITVYDTTRKDSSLSICVNEPIVFNGQSINSAGLYKDTLVNVQGCDSFVYLHLTIRDTSRRDSFLTICKNYPINFNGQTINTSGLYKDTLTNSQGCDSFVYLYLTVSDTTNRDSFMTICKNQPIVFNGQIINTTGVYKDTFTNFQGCDSFLYLHLTVIDTATKDSFLTICKNQFIVFKGQSIHASGVYKDTFTNVQGCDSFFYLHLRVLDTTRKDTAITICVNEPITFNGQSINILGLYKDTLVNYLGCDSFVYLTVHVSDTSRKDTSITICKNNPIFFNGQLINTPGLHKDTLPNFQGCDSFVYLTLTVLDTSSTNLYDTTCSNYPISFNNQNWNTTGTYRDTLTNHLGCDSFIYMHLYVNPVTYYNSVVDICFTETYDFYGRILSSSGTYKDTLVNTNNCDSIVTLTLNVNPLPIADAGQDQQRVNCAGDSVQLGTASTPNYSYNWSPAVEIDNPTISNPWSKSTIKRNYYLTVTNIITNCISKDTVEVDTLNSRLLASKTLSHLRCYNDFSGAVAISARNGYPAYEYKLGNSNYQLSNTLSDLSATTLGTYHVRDAKGCLFSDTFHLTEPDSIEIEMVSKKDLRCHNDSTGRLELKVSGGVGSFTYLWAPSQANLPKIENLDGGTYNLTVTDGNACQKTATYYLYEPDSIYLIDTNIQNNPCYGDSLASIEVYADGGIQWTQFVYRWSHGQMGSQATNLIKGIYKVTVEDDNLCTESFVFDIQDPPILEVKNLKKQDLNCEDVGRIFVSGIGGTPPYVYSINNGLSFVPDTSHRVIDTGIYQVQLRDAHRCLVKDSIRIQNLENLVIEVLPRDTTINITESVQLGFIVLEGDSNSIESLVWSPSVGLDCIDCQNPIASPFSSQIYSLEIQYSEDCISKSSANVRVGKDVELYIPNSFIPSSSNPENNQVKIYSNHILSAKLIIYNRWGEKMFETNQGHRYGWDGNYKGVPAPMAVYIYHAEVVYLDGSIVLKRGDVNLIR